MTGPSVLPTKRRVNTIRRYAVLTATCAAVVVLNACDRTPTEPQAKPKTELGKGGSEVSESAGPVGIKDAALAFATGAIDRSTERLLSDGGSIIRAGRDDR